MRQKVVTVNTNNFDKELKELNKLLKSGYKVVNLIYIPDSRKIYAAVLYTIEKKESRVKGKL